MGYGSRALQALNSFYSGEYFNLDEVAEPEYSYPDPSLVDEVSRSPWSDDFLCSNLSVCIVDFASHG